MTKECIFQGFPQHHIILKIPKKGTIHTKGCRLHIELLTANHDAKMFI